MLTRVEIDGFKSFKDFSLALTPFTVIIGPNSAGKSNLFDAFRLLNRLVQKDLRSSVQDFRGDPHELFRHCSDGSISPRLRFAVETLLEPRIQDAYGQSISLNNTRLRYEVEIERRMVRGIERLFVSREQAVSISRKDDKWRPYNKEPSAEFRAQYMKYSRRETPFLATADEDGQRTFLIHHDGSQGKIRRLPGHAAEAAVLSSITTASEFPHLYALREELRNVTYLQLNPAAERRPSSLDAPDTLQPDASNLAAVIYRIQTETKSDTSPKGALADIIADLSELIPGVVDLDVERDDERREFRLHVTMRDGQRFSSRVVSDGTLRVLALLTLLNDPRQRGVICFEEPENGISKGRLGQLMRMLRNACARPIAKQEDEFELPLLQIVVNTHSPVVADALREEVVLAEMAELAVRSGAPPDRVTRMRRFVVSEQSDLFGEDERRTRVSPYEIERFIEVREAQDFAA